MKLEHQLSLVIVLVFLIFIVFIKSPRRFYILFVLYFLPFIDSPITPPNLGSLRVFDGISYISFFVIFRDLVYFKKKYLIYQLLFSLFILVLFLGSINSDFIPNSLVTILSVFPIFIYSKAIIDECDRDVRFQKKIIQILKIIALFSVFFLLTQLIFGLDFTFYSELNRNTLDSNGIRYPSFFHDPQKYQQFLAMVSFLFLINYKHIEKPSYKNYLLFLLIISAMMVTGGRSAFLGLFTGMFLLFFFLGFRYKIFFLILCLLSSALLIHYSEQILILKRSETFVEDYLYRASLWNEALQIFKDHLTFGIGIGNYHSFSIVHSQNFFINEANDVLFFDQPESGYLKILSETGILGFAIFILFIMVPIINSIKTFLNSHKSIIILYMASILSWLVSFVSLFSLYDKRILILVIIFVCLLITKNSFKSQYGIKIKKYLSLNQ